MEDVVELNMNDIDMVGLSISDNACSAGVRICKVWVVESRNEKKHATSTFQEQG